MPVDRVRFSAQCSFQVASPASATHLHEQYHHRYSVYTNGNWKQDQVPTVPRIVVPHTSVACLSTVAIEGLPAVPLVRYAGYLACTGRFFAPLHRAPLVSMPSQFRSAVLERPLSFSAAVNDCTFP